MLSVMPLLFNRFGFGEIIILVLLVLVFFGGKKIPELMRGLGRGVREFKDAVNTDYTKETSDDTKTPVKEDGDDEKPAE